MSSTSLSSEHGTLPLTPIDKPDSLFARALFAISRKRYGMIPTAFRVMWARAPFMAFVSLAIAFCLERCLTLERELAYLLRVAMAMQNGCTFCADLTLAEAVRGRIGRDRFRALLDPDGDARFSARERAALAYARALQHSLHIPDEIWTQLSQHFSERERAELVWICAVERYFNTMALPLRIGSDHLADRA